MPAPRAQVKPVTEPLLILLAAALVNNLVTDHLLGISPMLSAAQRLATAADMALAVTVVTGMTALGAYALERLLIIPMGLQAYRLLLLVMAIACICQLCRATLGGWLPRLFGRDHGFHQLLLMNCMLLGVVLLGAQQYAGLLTALLFGIGAGLGFALVLLGFTAINLRLVSAELPAPLRGLPLQMITLGLISLSFSAFAGLHA